MAASAEANSRSIARDQFYQSKFPDFWYNWDNHEYAIYDIHTIDRSEVAKIRQTALQAYYIYDRVAPVLRNMDDETLLELGIPKQALSVVQMFDVGIGNSVVSRFDMIPSNGGYKIIEINSETPYFSIETNRINGEMCKEFGLDNPNVESERLLGEALAKAIPSDAVNVAVCAYNPYRECYFTAQYIMELMIKYSGRKDIRFVPIHELQVDEYGAFDSVGPIDCLYRSYPLEHFASDGEAGEQLFKLVEEGHLRIINPPSALLIQSKLAQAVIWGLMESKQYFNEAEREIIQDIFLPSYADLPQDGNRWVCKPVFGREGNSVTIYDPNGQKMEESIWQDYTDQPMLYQKCLDMPQIAYRNKDGEMIEGYAINTCFITGDSVGAVGMRVGGKITDAWARFLPLGMEPE